MGKYKQWLHHQEVGRRLRDQIASLEQERERVQKMAPAHPTTLPDSDNAIVAALQAYLRQGGAGAATVGRGADPRAAYGMARVVDTDPEPRRPASGDPVPAFPAGAAASTAARGGGAAPGVPARAEPTSPAATDGSANGTAPMPAVSPDAAAAPSADSVVGWWQRFRPQDDDEA